MSESCVSNWQTYQGIPVLVDAVRYTGTNWSTINEKVNEDPNNPKVLRMDEGHELIVRTNEGPTRCPIGHYLIIGMIGEVYPCDNEVFNKKYKRLLED